MTIDQYLRDNPCRAFRVSPFYSQDGDFLIVFFDDEDCYTKALTPEVEIYRANSDDRIVGTKIYGLRRLTARPPLWKFLADYAWLCVYDIFQRLTAPVRRRRLA